ncbi:tripartite tricarboxylate transporter permease [Lacrimispora sp.]|uniref:tripartite tricarboxylate transporter permease n=1 Tax=Lacrimispora sp. TaxID=2719234 RepID=UPI002FD8A0DD
MLDTFQALFQGFAVSFSLQNILACIAGVMVGTLTGVLPGIGVTGAMALLLPLSYGMDAVPATIMFAGIYYGAMYGGSTTSILVNLPGEAASVITCLDGNQMAKKGRAGAALSIAAIGSFIAGTIGLIGLTFCAPVLSRAALRFGPPEYFAISILGLVLLTNLTGKNAVKSFFMVLVGLMLSTVGVDSIAGITRMTFGIPSLMRGFEFGVVAMAVFGINDLFGTLVEPQEKMEIGRVKLRELYPTKQEMKRSVGPIFRGTFLGFLIGLMPGPAGTLASFSSYSVEKKLSKHPEEFGHGAIEGVAGPESSNNAASSAAMVPLLSLGLPFAPPAAMLLTGFIVHGITPGPTLITQHPNVFWGLVASMYIGNIFLVIINLPFVGVWASMLRTPANILMPVVMVVTFTGAFATNNSITDMVVLLVLGIFAYFISKYGYSMAPLAVGIVLGSTIEKGLIQGMIICHGSIWEMLTRPLSGTILWAALLLLAVTIFKPVKKLLLNSKED